MNNKRLVMTNKSFKIFIDRLGNIDIYNDGKYFKTLNFATELSNTYLNVGMGIYNTINNRYHVFADEYIPVHGEEECRSCRSKRVVYSDDIVSIKNEKYIFQMGIYVYCDKVTAEIGLIIFRRDHAGREMPMIRTGFKLSNVEFTDEKNPISEQIAETKAIPVKSSRSIWEQSPNSPLTDLSRGIEKVLPNGDIVSIHEVSSQSDIGSILSHIFGSILFDRPDSDDHYYDDEDDDDYYYDDEDDDDYDE